MTGAIAPSGPTLARLMASHVDPAEDLPVIELGPGTGVVTKALLERGVAPQRLIAIEFNPDFCRLLRERFPGVTVLQGDAYDLAGTLPKGRADRVSAIVSSLPLVSRPPADRARLIEAALDRDGARPPLHPVLLYAASAGRAGARPLQRRGLALDLAEPAAGAGLALSARRRLTRSRASGGR